jgi:putative ABC transport system substrate-binding protein
VSANDSVGRSASEPTMKRRLLLRGVVASVALLTTKCAAPPTVATRKLHLGAFTAEALPADGSRPLLEQEVDEGLRDAGYVAGENMTIEWRHAQGNAELLSVFANELVRLPVDILIASTTSAALAAKTATSTIPIVMQGCGDPIEYGLIQSYAHTGGNLTGTAFSNAAETAKRLELLREAFPATSRVVVIGNVPSARPAFFVELRRAADAMGIQLSAPEMRTDDDVSRALSSADAGDVLLVVGNTLVFQNIPRIVSFAAERRLPAGYSREADVRAGGLLSYGSNRREMRTRVGSYVHRIAAGAVLADLPVELPQKFDFAVNLGTAQRAGFSLAASLLSRATTVIP